jgi:hypothetical protein
MKENRCRGTSLIVIVYSCDSSSLEQRETSRELGSKPAEWYVPFNPDELQSEYCFSVIPHRTCVRCSFADHATKQCWSVLQPWYDNRHHIDHTAGTKNLESMTTATRRQGHVARLEVQRAPQMSTSQFAIRPVSC